MIKSKYKPKLQPTTTKAEIEPQVKKSPIAQSADDVVQATASPKQKILIVAHNHPHFFPGGAEIIAYDLFKTMKTQAKLEPFFMAGVAAGDRKVHTGTPFQTLSDAEDEILFWGADFDYFMQAQNIKSFMYLDFKLFLQKLRPDIIHFHHTMRIGLEALKIVREVLPNAKIIYTLHEYIFICNRDGQMVRKNNNELCSEYTPARCNQCFPDISPAEFKMREMFMKAHLQYVDMFISPSQFLADRFITWGIPTAKMTVLENGRKVEDPVPFRPLTSDGKRNVFGYFGQINPYKGATLAFKAVEYLVKSGFKDFRLEVFGNVEQQSEEFKKDFFKFVDKYSAQVGFHGKYKNDDMPRLIQMVDWSIVPSTWWENSPLVIQEAFMHKRPIIASDIGGMAEKVEHNVTGLHFQVRNEISLAHRIKEAAQTSDLWDRLSSNIQPRLTLEQCADKHYEIYDNL
jgi:glycosyltransferase involved in cell wall biosynthesis